jgi:hypothetical protein
MLGALMRRIVLVVGVALVVLAGVVSVAIARRAPGQTIWSLMYAYRWWVPALVSAVAALLLGWLVGAFLQQPWGAPWRAHVLAAADAIEHKLRMLPAAQSQAELDLSRSVSQAVQDHVRAARKAASASLGDEQRPSLGQQFVDWWTGASVEAAYVNLHEAEIALAQLLPEEEIEARIPEALARLQTMDVTDPRRRAAESELASAPPGRRRRAAFQTAVRIGLELKDQYHDRIRGFRNIVLTATLGLMSLVIALSLVGALRPDALPLCFGPPSTTAVPGQPPAPVQGPAGTACPSEEAPPTPGRQPRRLPAPGDVSLVALLGLLGGGLSAAVSIRHLHGSSTPYDVPVALSLLKLPSGALSAVVGLVFIRGEFVPGLSQLDNQPQILAYAFLFGIAQQLVTRLVDRQAQDVLTKVPSKEPTTSKPEPPLVEHQTRAQGQPEQPRRFRRRAQG